MALSGYGLGVFAEPVGMQIAPLEITSGDFAATATAAVQAFATDGLEDFGLGGHGSSLTGSGAA